MDVGISKFEGSQMYFSKIHKQTTSAPINIRYAGVLPSREMTQVSRNSMIRKFFR
jgi:hypothetical protein